MTRSEDNDAVETPQETTPLLPDGTVNKPKWSKSVLYRALICAFMVSSSFGVTQVPLVYVFRVMTCEAYYETHDEPGPGVDRCANHEIEAGTARAVSLLGASTTLFGVLNLFVTNWTIKRFGVKIALLIQVFWVVVRLVIQNVGVMTGSDTGILIVQCSQVFTIIGGPNGYVLACNSFVTEVTEHEERTGALGRLQGAMMFGAAIGFLAGGLIGDAFTIIAPFRVALALFLITFLYIAIFLPYLAPDKAIKNRQTTGIFRYFGPLKIFAPQKWMLKDGRTRTECGALLLGIGVFLGVLATGYLPTLLQLYSTNIFGFGTSENGWLIFWFSLLRGTFLTFVFPRIISAGRNWMQPRVDESTSSDHPAMNASKPQDEELNGDLPTSPNEIGPIDNMDNDAEPVTPPQRRSETETFAFDLAYAKFSLIADGLLTGLAAFVFQGWQLYLVAVLLPFASGTGAASKGTILQMIPSEERVDALSGITLVENIARLSTTAVFGVVFAALATVGKTYLVFVCNAGVALLGFVVLLFSRFPPQGSVRLGE